MAVCTTVLLETSVAMSALAPAPQTRTSAAVRKDQRSNNNEIRRLNNDIDRNRRETQNVLNQLNSINGEIEQVSANIESLQGNLDRTREQARTVADSITAMNDNLASLRADCAASLIENRRQRRSLSTLHLLFSSENFYQVMKRTGYVRQLESTRAQRIDRLTRHMALLDSCHRHLALLQHKGETTLAELASQNSRLARQQTEAQTLADRLRTDAATLQGVLAQRRRTAENLDRELNRVISSEAAARRAQPAKPAPTKATPAKSAPAKSTPAKTTPAKTTPAKTTPAKPAPAAPAKPAAQDRPIAAASPRPAPAPAPHFEETTVPALTQAGFAANKGRLLFPVSGSYNIVGYFGRQRHPNLTHVMIDNSGIDIEASAGTKARAVYDGEVSSIFYMEGLNNVVMVRHGEYLTVYANIDQLTVKKGDVVKAGQAVGRIHSDVADGKRTVLHFEVRKETQKLNPLEWVKR